MQMEGKNCFRTRWSQVPLYSGGNIASLLLLASQSSAPSQDVECLVMACGDTINVLRADRGDLLASYKLPVEDVILHIDAVSILGSGEANSRPSTNPRRKRNRRSDGADAEVDLTDTQRSYSAPRGSYIALGTRSLQIYVLRVDYSPICAEGVEHSTNKVMVADKEGGKEEAPQRLTSSADFCSDERGILCTLTPLRGWTAAQQAISVVQFTVDGRYLVSGSTDGGVKVWDVFNHHLTHNLHTPSTSLVHSIYVDPMERFLCVGSFEGHITVFDFVSKVMLAHGRPHVTAVEGMSLTPDTEHLLSIGRDRKLAILQLVDSALHEVRSVVVKEYVSAAVFESPFRLHIGAIDGTVSTYSTSVTEPLRLSRRLRRSSPRSGSDDDEHTIRSLLVVRSPKGVKEVKYLHGLLDDDHMSSLYAADASFNIALLVPDTEGNSYSVSSALVGFLDQVLDMKVFPTGSLFQRVVVTNSRDVRCYASEGCLSSTSLSGHSDIVLTCSISSDALLVATAGKDREIRFWSTLTWENIAIGQGGHESDITSIAFNSKVLDSYMVLFSVGADECLRLWDVGAHVLPALPREAKTSMVKSAAASLVTFAHHSGINAAHEGSIHVVAVSPNDQYVATGGKDKNVNLWTISKKKIFRDASLKGHRRAVSSLTFSPTDRLLASASNDGSVRLWSLVSLTCVKTLQTDRTPVLQLSFFNGGTQLVTGNMEGVLRVWAIAASEVVWSGETHEDKIWALCVLERGKDSVVFLSGSSDGVVVATEDYTAEEADRMRNERHEVILQEQELANALRRGQYTDAFLLALRLNHPRNLRQVITKWSAKDPQDCETSLRSTILPALDEEQLLRLLQFSREWVTNARHCSVASLVIRSVLSAYHFTSLAKMPAIRTILEALLAYMQRHSQRLHETLRRTYYIDYVTRSFGPPTLTSEPPFISASGFPEELTTKMQHANAA